MFGSIVIEVGLGLVIAFLLFSLILTSLQEGIEAIFKGRAKFLADAIGELLDSDPQTRAANVEAFYKHPLIFPLFSGAYKPTSKVGPTNLPSYLPSKSFAQAVEDLARSGRLNSTQVTEFMNHANELTGGGSGKAQRHLEDWFNSSMDRLSGQYKRNTQAWLFGIAFFAAAVGNVNAINIADSLASSQKLRSDVVAFSAELAREGALPNDTKVKIEKEVSASGLPIGWGAAPSFYDLCDTKTNCAKSTASMFAGWLITALAGMLGAPFWFDMLQKLVRLRTALKPREEAPAPHASQPVHQTDLPPVHTNPSQSPASEDKEILPEWRNGFVNAEEIRL